MSIWNVINLISMVQEGRGRIAQSVERPSKVPTLLTWVQIPVAALELEEKKHGSGKRS